MIRLLTAAGNAIAAGFKKNPYLFIGIASGILFLSLLTLRLNVFQGTGYSGGPDSASSARVLDNRDAWMNILQKDRKIGYVHRQFSRTDEGYRFQETMVMQINTMGMAQEVRVFTEGSLYPDLTLSGFRLELHSGLFNFRARGSQDGRTLTLFTGSPPSEEKVEVPLNEKLYSAAGIQEAIRKEDLRTGQKRTFSVFDPLTMSHRPFQATVLGDETVTVMGRGEKAKKVALDFLGTRQYAWIGEDGNVLKEEGFLGISLVRVSKNEALSGLAGAMSEDIAEAASILADITIQGADKLQTLRVRIEGIKDQDVMLEGGRQTFRRNVLTVRKESLKDIPDRLPLSLRLEGGRSYLEATPFIQAYDPIIRAQVRAILLPGDPVPVKAEKLVSWVYKNIRKRPVLSVPNALETLKNLMGDCNEHAVLLAALARSAGIPADVEAGIVYQNGRFYYHAWNILYLGRWITADATFGQFPADATHIRFARGTERQADLIGLIGKVRLKILEQKT